MRKRSTVHSAVTVVLLALSLVRCDEQALIDRFAGQQETKLAKEDIELLRAKNYPALLARFEPAHRQDPVLVDGLPKAADIFPADEPKNVKVIGYNAFVLKPLNAPSST